MESSAARRLDVLSGHFPYSHETGQVERLVGLLSSDVCGIIGYVGPENLPDVLTGGLRVLQNRGYDSAGIASVSSDGDMVVTKYASTQTTNDAIERLLQKAHERHGMHHIGMAHTRWATHGGKTDINAHPHMDQTQRVAVIHNGVIENSDELKRELKEKGVKFVSETDTEVIAQLIAWYLYQGNGDDVPTAVKNTLQRLQGTWGLVVLDKKDPSCMIAAKNGSPILIGIGKGQMFVASEAAAFSKYTNEFISLEDGEVVVVRADEHSLDVSRVQLAVNENIATSPAPYPHWTIREIMEQPEAVAKSLNYGARLLGKDGVKLGGLDDNVERMLSIRNLMIAACGTSYFSGLYGQKMMQSLSCFNTINVVEASEVTRESFPEEDAGLLVISQSGETKDVQRTLAIAEEIGIPTFSVVNVVQSQIARTTKCGVYLNAGREHAVASTKAFSCQVTVLALIAIWFSFKRRQAEKIQRRVQMVDGLHRLSTNFGMTLSRVHEQCKDIALRLKEKRSCFILGKGYGESIAREAALKIKELTYLHAEGYPAGALKHGPFALIEPGLPLFLIVLNDVDEALMVTAFEEVHAREAYTIVVTNNPSFSKAHETILIPSNGPFTALLAVIPFQLIAYELAVLRGHNPDYPRHLAKAVTV